MALSGKHQWVFADGKTDGELAIASANAENNQNLEKVINLTSVLCVLSMTKHLHFVKNDDYFLTVPIKLGFTVCCWNQGMCVCIYI